MLTPRPSSSRECLRLDGLWRFRFDPFAEGAAARWWSGPLPGGREMPVPASYNDLVTDPSERDYVGDVWYQREVWVPGSWAGRRIVLRCDAATHHGTMWAGDTQVAEHTGGYTPFEADVTALARLGEPLRVTLRVGNELTLDTIPPGVISTHPDGHRTQRYFHDFYNYAGLHRSVWLYSTPPSFIDGVVVRTDFDPRSGRGLVDYQVEAVDDHGAYGAALTSAVLRDADGAVVARATGRPGNCRCRRPGPGIRATRTCTGWTWPTARTSTRCRSVSARSGSRGTGCCSTASRSGCAASACTKTARCTARATTTRGWSATSRC